MERSGTGGDLIDAPTLAREALMNLAVDKGPLFSLNVSENCQSLINRENLPMSWPEFNEAAKEYIRARYSGRIRTKELL